MTQLRPRLWQAEFWTEAWYQGRWWLHCLRPLSFLFCQLAARRRRRLQASEHSELAVPLIVVGNISLGGTGKTPLLIAMARYLRAQGYKPGIISRGYGGQSEHYPCLLKHDSSASQVGDEPLLIQRETGCPVVVGPDRTEDVRLLLASAECDLILSDDGLQHYRMPRDIEIAVIDGARGLGNGLCLPAGPLREPPQRLTEVDLVVLNGDASAALTCPPGVMAETMNLEPGSWCSLLGKKQLAAGQLPCAPGEKPLAIAGIGNPERFFDLLKRLGIAAETHAFADHHNFQPTDFSDAGRRPVLMTAKDAVKCQAFAKSNWWYLAVEARLTPGFWASLTTLIESAVARKAGREGSTDTASASGVTDP